MNSASSNKWTAKQWEEATAIVNSKVEFVSELTSDWITPDQKLTLKAFDFVECQNLAQREKQKVMSWLENNFSEILNSENTKRVQIQESEGVVVTVAKTVSSLYGNKGQTVFSYERRRDSILDDFVDSDGKVYPSQVRIRNQNALEISYFRNGLYHRENAPASLSLKEDGSFSMWWCVNGEANNQNDYRNPVVIAYGYCIWAFKGQQIVEQKIQEVPIRRRITKGKKGKITKLIAQHKQKLQV